ncbi:MAG: alpha/beta hydrolase [Candidatus Promineifilaceae bacterium]
MVSRLAPKFCDTSSRAAVLLIIAAISISCQGQIQPTAPDLVTSPSKPDETLAVTKTIEVDALNEFRALLDQAETLRAVERQAEIDRYFAQLPSIPITQDSTALFIYRGDANTVQLLGDMNNWDHESAPFLSRLTGTDLWYLETALEEDARLDYQFIIDGESLVLDPLNPRIVMSGLGPNSELVMPAYEIPSELAPGGGAIAPGTIEEHTLDSEFLNQIRTFFVYEPASKIVGGRLPSVYFNDGGDYLNLIDTAALLDRLITDRAIPPIVAVFIPPIDRESDYLDNELYVRFLAEELVPFVQETYDTDPDSEKTGVFGASLGGTAALQTALSRPDVFGLAAVQSGAYSAHGDAVIEELKKINRARLSGRIDPFDLRVFNVVGTYETAVGGDPVSGNFLMANRRLQHALESSNFDSHYEERPEGHSWGLWEGTLGKALKYLYKQDM